MQIGGLLMMRRQDLARLFGPADLIRRRGIWHEHCAFTFELDQISSVVMTDGDRHIAGCAR